MWLALICLPEGLVFFYGMFSDCVPIFGSQRRLYICLMSIIQIATGVVLARTQWLRTPGLELEFAILVSICVMSRAWLTPVIESLMLIQMKRDPDYGADDLETFGLCMEAVGTAFYCILGGFMIEWNLEMPSVFFWLIVGTGVVTFLAGVWYPQASDDIDERYSKMSTGKRLKEKVGLFWEAISLPEVRNILIFFGVTSLFTCNLEEFLIYYNEMMLVTPLFEGYAEVVLFMSGAFIFTIYNNYVMSKSEIHITALVAILFRVICALFFAYDVAGNYSPGKTLMIQAVAVRSFVDAFLYLPGLILYTKMVPHHIEGMMIGFAWGLIKFNADVLARLITVGLNLSFMVQGEDMALLAEEKALAAAEAAAAAGEIGAMTVIPGEPGPFMGFYKLYLVQAGLVVFPIFFICILAKRARVEEVQMVLHHRHHHSLQHPEEAQVKLS